MLTMGFVAPGPLRNSAVSAYCGAALPGRWQRSADARTLKSIRLGSPVQVRHALLLPGAPTSPTKLRRTKLPYYVALEAADAAWKAAGSVDVMRLEEMLGSMLAKQLVAAADEAGRGGSGST